VTRATEPVSTLRSLGCTHTELTGLEAVPSSFLNLETKADFFTLNWPTKPSEEAVKMRWQLEFHA
jgi:hypothetical protein